MAASTVRELGRDRCTCREHPLNAPVGYSKDDGFATVALAVTPCLFSGRAGHSAIALTSVSNLRDAVAGLKGGLTVWAAAAYGEVGPSAGDGVGPFARWHVSHPAGCRSRRHSVRASERRLRRSTARRNEDEASDAMRLEPPEVGSRPTKRSRSTMAPAARKTLRSDSNRQRTRAANGIRLRIETHSFKHRLVGGKKSDSVCGGGIGGLSLPPFLAGVAGLLRVGAAGPLSLRIPRRVLEHPVQGVRQVRPTFYSQGGSREPFLRTIYWSDRGG